MLNGRHIAITEHRYERELIKLIERYGGEVTSCPLLEECLVENLPQVQLFVRRMIDPGFDMMVFFTGVGFRFLHEQAVAMGLDAAFRTALERTEVIVRGPKPQAAMRKLGVGADRVPKEATSEGLLDLLAADDIRGRRIGVQLYGVPNPQFCDPLEERGARVETVQVYEYRPVSDVRHVSDFIDRLVGGNIDAITFTSAPQVRSLFGHADELGMRESLVDAMNGSLVVVVIGHVTNRELKAVGVTSRVMPSTPKMGPMVDAMSHYFSEAAQ